MDFLTSIAVEVASQGFQIDDPHEYEHINREGYLHTPRDFAADNTNFKIPLRPNSTAEGPKIPSPTKSGGSPPTTPSFYSGLRGVNLERDARLIKLLWLSIIIVVSIVFALRLAQLFVSYIRKVYCMNTTDASQQKYWTVDHVSIWPWLKKNIIYAPLWKKRHNRELQLSGAVNYGTIPGRVHTILLVLYAFTNLVYCLLLDWNAPQRGAVYAELRGRSGTLATVNIIPLIVLAQRNNPAIPILNVSFDTFNLFHRWIGRMVVVLSTVHFLAWLVAYTMAKGKDATFKIFLHSPFLGYGLFGLIPLIILPIHSLSPIRHAFYETFLHLHQTLAFLALLGIYVHLDMKKLPAYPSILTAMALLLLERLWRIARILHLNYSRHGGTTTAYVEALPGDACRVTFQLPRHITIRPGSHVYAYLPAISLWMSHPFSVAWTNVESEPPTGNSALPTTPNSLERQSVIQRLSPSKAPTSVSLIMAARTGMTRKLYQAARASPNDKLCLKGFLEGPYAGHDSLVSYGTVVMFAGGAGIMHHLVQVRHLLAGAATQTVATRKIVLVWSIRDTEWMEWVKPWMTEILHMERRREVLKILVYVSRPTRPINTKKNKETMALVQGRVDPAAVLDGVLPKRVGAVMVSVCGPGGLADEVRAEVRKRMDTANLELNEESFTW